MIKTILLVSAITLSYSAEDGKIRRRLALCPNPDTFPNATQPLPNCTGAFVDDDFETSMNGWYGNLGANQELSSEGHTSKYLKVHNRLTDWQGPILELNNKVKGCIAGDNTYLFQVDIRLSKASGVSNCKASGTDCPILKWNHMSLSEKVRSWPLSQFAASSAVNDGTWTTWYNEFKIPSEYIDPTDIFAALSINGPEAGVDISIDNIKIFLAPAGHYPDPNGVCDELITNGNAAASKFFKFPIESFIPSEPLDLVEDANGRYFSMSTRSKIWSGPKYDFVPGCFRDGAIYKFSAKIWIHDATARKSRMIIRYSDGGQYKFDTVAICPDSSDSIGWVDCTGSITFTSAKYHTPPFVMSFMTHDTTAKTDWRDMSLKAVTCGSVSIGGGGGSSGGAGSGSCTRSVKVNVDAAVDSTMELTVGNGTASSNIASSFISIDDNMDTHWYNAKRFYSFSLSGGDWTGSFKLSGNNAWPYFAEIVLGDAPSCTGYMNSFTIAPPAVDATTCNNLIRNGNFETGDLKTVGWYHSGGGMQIVNGGVTGRALSTNGRTNPANGLVQFIDTRCMTTGQKFDISAKVKLVDPKGSTTPTCDPSSRSVGGNRCPRANIRTSKGGSPTGYSYAVGNTLAPFTAGQWNTLYGTFTVDANMLAADQIAFYIDGVAENIDILIDDVTITKAAVDSSGNCVNNGDFEVGDSRDWECVGTLSCGLKMVQPGQGGSAYALSTTQRLASYWGMKQNLLKTCFKAGTYYEINAYMKLTDANGNTVACDPYLYYQGVAGFCPNVLLQHPDQQALRIRVAPVAGPVDTSGWNHIYGVAKVTNTMLGWPALEAFIGWAQANVNVVIDSVSIKPANSNTYGILDCTQLVSNGDAEIGDARFWFIRGSGGYGTVNMVTGGAGGSKFAFHHAGSRTKINMGMWQELDKTCMPLNSKWTITSNFKLFDASGNAVSCDKTVAGGATACPMWRIEGYDGSGSNIYGSILKNNAAGTWNANGWNAFQNSFTMDANFVAREKFFIYVYNVPVGYTYMVDDIAVKPAA